ncbi:photosynthetic complex putative assembly protein PuhB [Jannaschia sp. KMU-145]|uniref:photosynthetic complex putative assembly protein PuhB n=1 Tax=Jannaschia halovivens TaxID=3388667 RepID=UPI00396B04A1
MTDHDDFDQEPIRGLPELLPEGEEILWQGSPDWWALTKESLSVRGVALYFGLLFGWQTVSAAADVPWATALAQSSFYLVLGAVTCAILAAIGWCQAKAAIYTITNRRVILRIGAALTMTLQFPFRWIAAADLTTRKDGTGTIALRTLGETRFSYLMIWPHLRPWRFTPTQPALRAIPKAAEVARLLAEAAQADLSMPQVTSAPVAPTPDTGAMPVPAE